MDFSFVKLEIYVPDEYVETLRDRLNQIGACRVGNYDHVLSVTKVAGSWRPLEGSRPFEGAPGTLCNGTESKMEVRCPASLCKKALTLIRQSHPYEEPVVNIVPLLDESSLQESAFGTSTPLTPHS